MSKKVIIIGAGVAGLSAGSYLQMNGYDTEIHELHTLPGGLCTSWDRNGYIFDTCIHWLVGSNEKDPFYFFWNELIDMKKLQFVYFDKYTTVEDEEGRRLDVFSDLNKLREEFLKIAPEDKQIIEKLVKYAKKLLKINLKDDKPQELQTLWDKSKFFLGILPYINLLNKLVKITSEEFAAGFKNPLLRFTMEQLFTPDMAFIFNIFILKWFHEKSSGYPIGGSLNFSKLIEKRYLELGGKIHYHSRVNRVLIENDKAIGIETTHGVQYFADYVISAADGHSTLFKMLEEKYVTAEMKKFYEENSLFSSYIQVSLGINKTFENSSSMMILKLKDKFRIDDKTESDAIGYRIYNFDETLAPKGKTVITVVLGTYNHQYWENLRKQNHKEYHKEKERLADIVIDILDKKLGGIKDLIEETDVSTPATIIRYTENWKGSFEGWVMTPKIGFKQIKKTIPNLDNFYMIGQWVEPGGGLPTALTSGRKACQLICKKDNLKFKTISF